MPRITTLCLMLGILVFAGCRKTDDTAGPSVQLQLNWIPDAQHGGFLAAKSQWMASESTRQLVIRPGGPGTPVLPNLVMGKVDFAIANADQVLMARANGADIVAVFAALQHSPRCIMVHAESGIERLADLHDLSLAMGEGKAYAEFLKAHTTWRNVRIVAYTGSVARFLSEANFAQQAYSFSEPLVVEQRGGRVKCLMVSELGFDPYASLLVTRGELIESQPELVRQVVSVVRQGWTTYLDDPSAVHRELQELNPEMDAEVLARSVDEVRKLCLPEGMAADMLGTMEEDRWRTLAEQLLELRLIDDKVNAQDAFTLQFIR